ncbi:hypothetical protein PRIPAC_94324, partial [Pristionchus pacificus]
LLFISKRDRPVDQVLHSMDREKFLKDQRQSVHKALTKEAVPLKLKHAQIVIHGTHQDQSASAFWGSTSTIALDKHPLVTWKFCHLLHALIRDGHGSVLMDSQRHLRRISRAGDFWLHLHASGYGSINDRYCGMICERLEFHRKYPRIPGNLVVSEHVLHELNSDRGVAFQAAVDVLDLMKSLLLLPKRVFTFLDFVENPHNSQIQTILAPLILVIYDTEQLYILLCNLMNHLHSIFHPEELWLHRKRFQETQRQIMAFYNEVRSIPYFTHHVNVPTLSLTQNFVHSSQVFERTQLIDHPRQHVIVNNTVRDPPPYELLLPD